MESKVQCRLLNVLYIFYPWRFLLLLGMHRWKRFWLVVCATCLGVVMGYAQQRDTLRILAIGNSFSEDAVEQYLHELASAGGRAMVIGNLYIGGAPLSLHWENAQGDRPAYSYRKIGVDGQKTTRPDISLREALRDEPWDYVSLQQASPFSGRFESYLEPLPSLHRYIDSVSARKVRHIWHQTWAYAPTSNHEGFAYYNRDQHKMYRAIMDASSRIKKLVRIDLLVPCGTAIQNARTTFLGDDLTRDGYHLDLHIGRFIAACTWYTALFGHPAPVDRYRPDDVSEAAAVVAAEAARKAVKRPFRVTKVIVN